MPATTPDHALPYLELTDPPDIAGGLQALAEAVDTELTRLDTVDAGGTWQTLSLAAGVDVQAGVTPGYRRIGGQVFLRGLVKKASGSWAAGTTYTLTGTAIGSGYRPSQAQYRQVAGHSADSSSRLTVLSTGVVELTTGAAAPAYVDLSGAAPWLLG